MFSTIICLLSANEHCCILDSGIKSNPVNVQSRSKPIFSEPLPSTHHCSRGWARGSSLSICFLISRYEPWERKKKTQPCVVCSVFLVFHRFPFFVFFVFYIGKWASVWKRIHDSFNTLYKSSQDTVERRVRKYRDEKLICNCHLDKQWPHPCSLNTTVQSKYYTELY